MNILSFDTSTDHLTIAVMKGGKAVARFHRKVGRNHSTLLVPTIARMLAKARLKTSALDLIAVGVGPGSFTGLRIGAAVAKGLSYATGVPVAAVPTFDAIAQNGAREKGVVCVVLDARKGKVYGCLYKSDGKYSKRISKYLLMPAADLLKLCGKYDKVVFMGDGLQLVGAKERIRDWQPRADSIGRIGQALFRTKKLVKAADLEPMYLYSRECDITGK
jgi:tRNA threonylcarbamoyladenosine biosynthesis protein TsaB